MGSSTVFGSTTDSAEIPSFIPKEESKKFRPLALYGYFAVANGIDFSNNELEMSEAQFGLTYVRQDLWGGSAEYNSMLRVADQPADYEDDWGWYVDQDKFTFYSLRIRKTHKLAKNLRLSYEGGPSYITTREYLYKPKQKVRPSDSNYETSFRFQQIAGASLAANIEIPIDPLFGVELGTHVEISPVMSYIDFHFTFGIGLYDNNLHK